MSATPFRTQVLLHGDQTNGEVSVVENLVPAGWAGPPLHHHAFDEAFYVLEGKLTFQVAGALITAGPGELTFASRGVHHTLANRNGVAARYLLICTPAGFERYFARIAAEQAGVEPPSWAQGPIPDVSRVGPQIGERAIEE